MGPAAVLGFGVGGCGRQDGGDVLKGFGTGGAPVHIIYVVHDTSHFQDDGGGSPSGGSTAYR